MASSLDSTYGVWLVSLFLETMSVLLLMRKTVDAHRAMSRLYGMGVLQVWLYFHWYPNDSRNLKTVVRMILPYDFVFVDLPFDRCSYFCMSFIHNVHAVFHADFNSALETLQISFLFSATYKYLIKNFGNLPALVIITWSVHPSFLSRFHLISTLGKIRWALFKDIMGL